jgi:hypothetical protein
MPQSSERRKTSRLPAGENLVAEIVGVRQAVTLVNLGSGGFSVATKEWLPSLEHPQVRFHTPDKRWSATFEIRMSFALLQPRKSGPYQGRFITGFAFRDAKTVKAKKRIQELLERVAPVTV